MTQGRHTEARVTEVGCNALGQHHIHGVARQKQKVYVGAGASRRAEFGEERVAEGLPVAQSGHERFSLREIVFRDDKIDVDGLAVHTMDTEGPPTHEKSTEARLGDTGRKSVQEFLEPHADHLAGQCTPRLRGAPRGGRPVEREGAYRPPRFPCSRLTRALDGISMVSPGPYSIR